MAEFFTLQKFINLLSQKNGLHVCVHDVDGVTERTLLKTELENLMHASSFCDAAKSTPNGYERCVSHKNKANIKALNEKKAFCGFCPYGLFEAVKPVIIDEKAVCIVYVGHVTTNDEKTRGRIKNTCKETGVPDGVMFSELKKIPRISNGGICMETAEAIDSVIRLLYEKSEESDNSSCHWVVKRMVEYAKINFDKKLSLKQMSMLYFMDEKYIGRLFKRCTGSSFSEYVNSLRMKYAARLLSETDRRIIDISAECGYNNVTYFNRVFENKYKITPTEYRTLHRK